MKSRLSLIVSVVVLTIFSTLPSVAAPAAGPCTPGAVYNASCDANQDGQITVTDIQLTAGHWNQSGTFTSDNNHNHLGQTWMGNDNPVTLQGAFAAADANAPLRLSNANGVGLRIETTGNHAIRVGLAGGNGLRINEALADGVSVGSAGSDGVQVAAAVDDGFDVVNAGNDGLFVGAAGDDGVQIDSAVQDGLYVGSAGRNGIYVCATGSASGCNPTESSNGVRIGGAENYGVLVDAAGQSGVRIESADINGVEVSAVQAGVQVNSAGQDGVRIYSAGFDGVRVWSADENGVTVWSAGDYAAFLGGNVHIGGTCTGCLQANFAVNAGDRTLQPGDVVSVLAVRATDFDAGAALWQVTAAQPGQVAIGVVAGRAELVTVDEPRPTETGQRLVPREGAAQPGEYVTVVYSGPMQVRVAPGEGVVDAGTRLTAAQDGAVRPLGVITVQLAGAEGTANLSEDAPIIGVALEPAGDGLVWVLVNPQ